MSQLIISDIRTNWEKTRIALREIAAENNAAWIPEDIFVMVKNNLATFFVTDDGLGFVILQVMTESFSGDRILHIVVAHHPGKDPQEKYREAIDQIAIDHQCAFVECESLRKGFERKGGWNLDRMVFRRGVKYG